MEIAPNSIICFGMSRMLFARTRIHTKLLHWSGACLAVNGSVDEEDAGEVTEEHAIQETSKEKQKDAVTTINNFEDGVLFSFLSLCIFFGAMSQWSPLPKWLGVAQC
jgi:hypothetical protein